MTDNSMVGQWVGIRALNGDVYKGFIDEVAGDYHYNVWVLDKDYVPGQKYEPKLKRIFVSGLMNYQNELHAYDRATLIDLALDMKDLTWFGELTNCLRVKQ